MLSSRHVATLAATILGSTAPAAAPDPYAAFVKENDAAMAKMMADMAVKPTGKVDVDFVAMMIPHHQGAVDMAKAVLRYGKNDRLNAIARNIVATQEREIVMMRAAVGGRVPVAEPGMKHGHHDRR